MATKKSKSGIISRKTKSWLPVFDLKFGHNQIQTFSTEQVSSIWEAAGLDLPVPDGLLDELSRALARYMMAVHLQQKPTTHQLADQTQLIADLSAQLLEAILVDGKLRSGLGAGGLWARAASKSDPTGSATVKKVCEGVAALHSWATDMSNHQVKKLDLEVAKRKSEGQTVGIDSEMAASESKPNNEGDAKRERSSDFALNSLVGELAEIYLWYTDEIPRPSRKKGKPSAFFAFLIQTLQFMKLPQSEEAISLLIRRHGQMDFEK